MRQHPVLPLGPFEDFQVQLQLDVEENQQWLKLMRLHEFAQLP